MKFVTLALFLVFQSVALAKSTVYFGTAETKKGFSLFSPNLKKSLFIRNGEKIEVTFSDRFLSRNKTMKISTVDGQVEFVFYATKWPGSTDGLLYGEYTNDILSLKLGRFETVYNLIGDSVTVTSDCVYKCQRSTDGLGCIGQRTIMYSTWLVSYDHGIQFKAKGGNDNSLTIKLKQGPVLSSKRAQTLDYCGR